MKRQFRRVFSLIVLDTTWAARKWLQKPSNPEEEEALLRAWLRRRPYWREGHRRLVDVSLAKRGVTQAYASALACRALALTDSERRRADWLLGRCMLAVGDGAEARERLERAAARKDRFQFAVQEDLAAAYNLLGDDEKSKEILNGIPPERRSAQAEAFLRSLSGSADVPVR